MTPQVEEFRKYLHTVGYQKNTISIMVYALKEFTEKVHKPPIAITKRDMETYAQYLETRPNHRRGGGLSTSMLRQYLYGLKVYFNWQEQTEKIGMNPMSGIVLPEVENMERVVLTQSEIKQLYEVCTNYQDRSILGLFYGCGLRRSEGEALDRRDIDFVKKVLYVRKGKGGKRRVVPLSQGVKRDLLSYAAEERPYLGPEAELTDMDAFMMNNQGRRMKGSSYNKRLKTLLKKAGILKPITLHSLRHSIATHLLEKGLSLEQVRDFLGHTHLETTQIYLHDEYKNLSG